MEKEVMVVTTGQLPGYKVKKVLGVVSGLTARTRGIGGKFVAGFEAMLGGEVRSFTSEMEKARVEALERLRENAAKMGANAVLKMDIETSEVFRATVLLSATGTAAIVEKAGKKE
jgi:uncharacterized protein YbjQ (UPF0145 family)